MPYWRCYYHVVWATKHRQPIILSAYESLIFAAIEEKSRQLGCTVLTINSVSDHVHVAVSLAPRIALAEWVGSIKGVSARAINISVEREERFHWQEGYGGVTFGERSLQQIRAYIEGQKERHAKGDLNAYLERTED